MRTTIRVNDELLLRAKRKAAREGHSLSSLVEDGLLMVLSKTQSKALPTSTHEGGLRPGIDINSNAELLDLVGEHGDGSSVGSSIIRLAGAWIRGLSA